MKHIPVKNLGNYMCTTKKGEANEADLLSARLSSGLLKKQ